MKILYVGSASTSQLSGGAYVDNRNLVALQQIVGRGNVFIFRIPHSSWWNVMVSLITFRSYGISPVIENRILQKQAQIDADLIFIEGTIRGNLVKRLNRKGAKTIVMAHNVESVLYQHRARLKHNIVSWIQSWFVKYNEKKTVIYADRIIALNERDCHDMIAIYGRAADAILPITCTSPTYKITKVIPKQPYCLFVGSNFLPNIEGITWFITNVAPYIGMNVRVVGSCCENPQLKKIKLPNNVYLDGYVNDLSQYYLQAAVIIAPIFSGSGMKTKTIEAVSYGKSIVGTNEAFIGIQCDYNKIGGLCNTASEFIQVLSTKQFNQKNPYTLQLFHTYFTNDLFVDNLRDIIFQYE